MILTAKACTYQPVQMSYCLAGVLPEMMCVTRNHHENIIRCENHFYGIVLLH